MPCAHAPQQQHVKQQRPCEEPEDVRKRNGVFMMHLPETPSGTRGQAERLGVPTVWIVRQSHVQKGIRHHLPERPGGCCAPMVPDPFLNHAAQLNEALDSPRLCHCFGEH